MDRPTNTADFTQTHWSVVLRAGDGSTPEARAALDQLCRAYWMPLYAYVRRRGHSPEEAQDLTQEFFLSLIVRQDFVGLDRSKGRFRAFLLGCMNHFLAKDWQKRMALKRGGGQSSLALDGALAEEHLRADLSSSLTPERLFDRRWALSVMEQALQKLREELERTGQARHFVELKRFLTEPGDAAAYTAVAGQLQMNAGAVATAVHRFRKRFRNLVQGILAQTVTTPLELAEELEYFRELLASVDVQ